MASATPLIIPQTASSIIVSSGQISNVLNAKKDTSFRQAAANLLMQTFNAGTGTNKVHVLPATMDSTLSLVLVIAFSPRGSLIALQINILQPVEDVN
jgi:hypothetical protein